MSGFAGEQEAAFETLLAGKIELNVVDGIILPNLKMAGAEDGCGFLTEEGRCGIHPFRPGICRLFPLGRYYEEKGFRYFLQVHECQKENWAKVKVKKWLDTPDLKKYEAYIARWHGLLIQLQEYIAAHPESAKAVSMDVLQRFLPYSVSDGRIFTVNFSREWTKQKGILLNTIEIIGDQGDEFFGLLFNTVMRVKERPSCFLTKICKVNLSVKNIFLYRQNCTRIWKMCAQEVVSGI